MSLPEVELLKIRSFGKTSLREIKRKVSDMGMTLGMSVPLDEPVEIIEEDADAEAEVSEK